MVLAVVFDEFGDAGLPPTDAVSASKARADALRAERMKAISASGEAKVVKRARRFTNQELDGPTPEREAKGAFDTERGLNDGRRQITVVRDMAPTLIARLHKKGRLDDDQVAAAKWYYETWYRAGFEAKSCAWLHAFVDGGRSGEGEEDKITARDAARHALAKARSFLGAIHPSAVGIIDRVVIWGETAAETAGSVRIDLSRQVAEARVAALLEAALYALAKHRGIGA